MRSRALFFMFGVHRFGLAVMVVLSHLWRGQLPWVGMYAVFGFYVVSGYLMTS